MMQQKPLVSFIIPARNDTYMGDFHWRLTTSLNFLADNLLELGRLKDVEVLIADWGSEKPLDTVLCLNHRAETIVRFITVAPSVAKELQKDSHFPIVLAQNAAVRRANGIFIGQTDSDVLFPVEFLNKLLAFLDQQLLAGRACDAGLLYVKRRHIPWKYTTYHPSRAELSWLIRHFGRFFPLEHDPTYPHAATGAMIMHRDIWHESTGYDESLIYWGWMEIDLGLRIRQRYPLLNLSKVAGVLFHLEHYPSRTVQPRKANPMNQANAFRPNGTNWGLADLPLRVFSYHNKKGAPASCDCLDPSVPFRKDWVGIRRMIEAIITGALNSSKMKLSYFWIKVWAIPMRRLRCFVSPWIKCLLNKR